MPFHKFTIEQEGVEKQVDMRVVTNSCKRYFNSIHQLSRISKSERLFYDYLCETMDSKTNQIYIDKDLKRDFSIHMAEWTGKELKISPKSIPIFIKHLVEARLIMPYRARKAAYQVNPKYAFRGTETLRKKLLADEIEWCIMHKQPFSHLIDTSEELFLDKMIVR